jgi:uncharacterized protein (TIGR02145 family)
MMKFFDYLPKLWQKCDKELFQAIPLEKNHKQWRFTMKNVLLALPIIFFFACNDKQINTFTDSRDGKTYKYAQIGEQAWMAENLNYEANGSKCYGNAPDNCTKYGRLYTQEGAAEACPAGWHLPNDAEWQKLVDFAGGEKAGKKLRVKEESGSDDYGFSALPGGGGRPNGNFEGIGGCVKCVKFGLWWSASKDKEGYGVRDLGCYNGSISLWIEVEEDGLYSVRCIKD